MRSPLMDESAAAAVAGALAEQARLDALRELQVLDTGPEQPFDDLVWLAARLCDAPIALVSLVDGQRQWFKARWGLDITHTPRSEAFCSHAIAQDGCFEVEDARLDPRFAALPLVAGETGVRSYAGMPLVDGHGHRLGTLCVMDRRARRLTPQQREGLMRLARRAVDSLQTRLRRLRAESRERTLARLLEAMPDAVVTCDAQGLLGEFNKVAREWHGVDPRALPPQQWARHFNLYEAGPAAEAQADAESAGSTDSEPASGARQLRLLPTERIPLLRAWRGERVREAALVIRAAGQPPRTVLCNADPLLSADGQRLGAVCVMHDITARLAAEARLRESAQHMRTVADHVPAFVAHVGADLRYRFVNRHYAQWFGMEPAAMVGQHMGSVLGARHYARLQPRLRQVLAGETVVFELDVVRPDGARRRMRATYVPDGPVAADSQGRRRCGGIHLMVHDVTEQAQLARVLRERAMTDPLTGLPNRAAWLAELERGLARAQRAGVPAAVMFLDLDGFKQVNDRHGHAVGDALLCEFARRLRHCLRRSDFVARLAGDEFVVLLDGVAQPGASPQAMAERVLSAMEAPLHVEGHTLRLAPSIGVAVQRRPALDAALLMRKADEAMYAAKRAAQAGVAVLAC